MHAILTKGSGMMPRWGGWGGGGGDVAKKTKHCNGTVVTKSEKD